jgi:hypothetical protein
MDHRLAGFSDDELRAELASRAPGCQCGPYRRDVTAHGNDSTFWPRKGCATCDRWDGPVKVKEK